MKKNKNNKKSQFLLASSHILEFGIVNADPVLLYQNFFESLFSQKWSIGFKLLTPIDPSTHNANQIRSWGVELISDFLSTGISYIPIG